MTQTVHSWTLRAGCTVLISERGEGDEVRGGEGQEHILRRRGTKNAQQRSDKDHESRREGRNGKTDRYIGERESPTATALTEPGTYPFDGTLKPREKEKTLRVFAVE